MPTNLRSTNRVTTHRNFRFLRRSGRKDTTMVRHVLIRGRTQNTQQPMTPPLNANHTHRKTRPSRWEHKVLAFDPSFHRISSVTNHYSCRLRGPSHCTMEKHHFVKWKYLYGYMESRLHNFLLYKNWINKAKKVGTSCSGKTILYGSDYKAAITIFGNTARVRTADTSSGPNIRLWL